MSRRGYRGRARRPVPGASGPVRFELGGGLVVEVREARDDVVAFFELHMDPYAPSDAGTRDPAVLLEHAPVGIDDPRFSEILNPARDGTASAFAGGRHHLLLEGRSCSLPDLAEGLPLTFTCQPGFSLPSVFSRVIRPALHLALLRLGAVAVHGSSVRMDGGGLVIAGWSETGKTETALALAERGAEFISDKWTIIGSDRVLSPFPISVGIRRWVLPYLPRLRSALPRRARAQFSASAAVGALAGRALPRMGRRAARAAGAARGLLTLADRAALRPSEVIEAYGGGGEEVPAAPLSALALLVTVPHQAVSVEAADRRWAARRLARCAAYERRDFFALYERGRYGLLEQDGDVAAQELHTEETLLEKALSAITILAVRAPFPTDPRRVADAIALEL